MNVLHRGVAIAITAAVLMLGVGCAKKPPDEYYKAIELIHSGGSPGFGDVYKQVAAIEHQLNKADSESGLAEALRAEWRSTWQLQQPSQYMMEAPRISQLIEESLRKNPDLVQPHVSRARTLIAGSKFKEARAALESALKAEPANVQALLLLADLQMRDKQFAEAEASALKAIEFATPPAIKANGHYILAKISQQRALLDAKDKDKWIKDARTAFENALSLNPGVGQRHLEYSEFLSATVGDYASAELYALKANQAGVRPLGLYHAARANYLKLLPAAESMDHTGLRKSLAEIERKFHVSLADAVAIVPTKQFADSALAPYIGHGSGLEFDVPELNPLTCVKELQPAAAEMFAEAKAILDDPTADGKRLDDAAELLSVVIKQQPFYAESYRELARYHLRSSDVGGWNDIGAASNAALRNLYKVMRLVPEDADAALGMAHMYGRLERSEEARAAFEQARPHIQDKARLRFVEVSVLQAEGKMEEAIASLEEALANATGPTRTAVLEMAASFYTRGMEPARAEPLYAELIKSNPSVPYYQSDLARMLICTQVDVDRGVTVARQSLAARNHHFGRQTLAAGLLLKWADALTRDEPGADAFLGEALTMSYPHPPQVIGHACGASDAVRKVNDAHIKVSGKDPMYFQQQNVERMIGLFRAPKV